MVTVSDGRELRARIAGRLLIAASLCVAIAGVAYVLMVRTALGQRFDNAALIGAFQGNTVDRLNDGFFIARASATAFIAALAIVLAVSIVRRRLRIGIALVAMAVFAVVFTHALKIHVLTRPTLVASDNVAYSNTYPSGHTATAIAAALVLVVIAPPAVRGIVAILAGTYAAVIAQDVQTAAWHRPSDAIGAAFVVFALVALVAAAFAWWRPISTTPQRTHVVAYPVLAIAALVSGVICTLDAGHALHTLRHTSNNAIVTPALRNDAHAFSVALTVLVVAALLAALLALLGSAELDAPPRRTSPPD